MLKIKNLSVASGGKLILENLSLNVGEGEVHAIMGPNGAGKSTLSKVLAGHPEYEVKSGSITYEVNLREKDLLAMAPEERARAGIFLGYQYPVEIPGVTNRTFLRAAFNAICRAQGSKELSEQEFAAFAEEKAKLVGAPLSFLDRSVNVGFSGGEKKRNEILQMAILSPRLAVLDETDSGLDVDALKEVAFGINKLRSAEMSIILITHYEKLLDLIKPDHVHILSRGKIVRSGDRALAHAVETSGYEGFAAP